MQSKISFCNLTVIKKDITGFWPLWAVELFLLQLGNVYLYFTVQRILYSDEQFFYNKTIDAQLVLLRILTINTNVVLAAVCSIAAAILVFGYLSRKKACYAVHSMPISRKTLFVSHFMAGLFILIVPCVCSYFVTEVISLIFGLGMGANILGMALEMLLVVFFFYSMACMLVMLSGNGTMSAIIYGVLNVLAVGMSLMLTGLVGFISYGADSTNIREVVKGVIHFTPLYYFSMATDNDTLRNIYDRLLGSRYGMMGIDPEKVSQLSKFPWEGLGACAVYLFPAVLFCIAAWFLYKKRPLENTGDTMPFPWSKFIFRIVFSISGGMLLIIFLSVFVLQAVFDGGNLTYRAAFLLYMLFLAGGCTVCYFISEMILAKEFNIWKKVSFVQMGAAFVITLVLLVLAKESYKKSSIVPAQDVKRMEISFCGVTYYYKGGEVPEEVEELQRKIMEAGNDELFYGDYSEETCADAVFTYITKDNRTISRNYPFSGHNEEVLTAITDFFERQEEKEKKMFPEACSGENLFSYGISMMDEENEVDRIMTHEQKQAVLEGVIADIKEGNLEIADWRQFRKNQENEKMLYLSFDLEQEDFMVEQELFISKNCIHTLQALTSVKE